MRNYAKRDKDGAEMLNEAELRELVISKIEGRFPGVTVVWSREGYPEQKASSSKIQVFEVLELPENQYESFSEVVSELRKAVARPNGFSIIVHDLTPEETHEYRQRELEAELERRKLAGFTQRYVEIPLQPATKEVMLPVAYQVTEPHPHMGPLRCSIYFTFMLPRLRWFHADLLQRCMQSMSAGTVSPQFKLLHWCKESDPGSHAGEWDIEQNGTASTLKYEKTTLRA